MSTLFSLQEPLRLGLGLAGIGVSWLFIAALLSVLLPAKRGLRERRRRRALSPEPAPLPPEAPLHSAPPLSQSVRDGGGASGPLPLPLLRKQIDNHYQGLLERVMALEHSAPPVLSAYDAYALLNQKSAQLKKELDLLHDGVRGRHAQEHTQTELAQRVEGLARKVAALIDRGSLPVPPVRVEAPPSLVPVKEEPPRSLAAPLLDDARAAREMFVGQSEELARRADAERLQESKALQGLQSALSDTTRVSEELQEKLTRFLDERETLQAQQQQLALDKQAMGAGGAAETLARDNARIKEQMDGQSRALSEEQESRRRALERLEKRLGRWRVLWTVRLSRQRERSEAELTELRRHNESLRVLLEQGRLEAEQGLRHVEEQWNVLRQEQEDFKRHSTEQWPAEQAQSRERLAALELQRAELESSLKSLADRRLQEKIRFEEGVALLRQTVREERHRWREQVRTQRAEKERLSQAAEAELSQAREAYADEKKSMNEAVVSRRNALQEETGRLAAGIEAWKEAAGRERAESQTQLQNAVRLLAEREKARESLEEALKAEQQDYAQRRRELYHWAGTRFETFERIIQEIHREAAARREALGRERQTLMALLEKERVEFHETLTLLENQYQKKTTDLEQERTDAETSHAGLMAKARAEETRLEQAARSLGETIAGLEREAEALRRHNTRRMARRKERYERLLVRLEHASSQERADAEVRLAEQRMELEGLRHRLTLRKARVESWQRRRREALEHLFNEAHQALELVRQGHARDEESWRRRVGELEAQRALLESRRQALSRAPGALAEDLRRQEHLGAEAFENEKSRLAREAEARWNAFLERSAANHAELKKALSDFQTAETDLLRQEKAAREFLDAARRQVQQFQSLKEKHLVLLNTPSSS